MLISMLTEFSINVFCRRFRISDVPGNVSKGSPDFCTVYVIHKGKISSVRNASRSAPFNSPLLDQIQKQNNNNSFQSAAPSAHSFQSAARSGHSFQGHARQRSLSMKGLFPVFLRDNCAFHLYFFRNYLSFDVASYLVQEQK